MAARQKGQLYEVYASKGLFGRLASTLPKLGSTRRLNNQPSIGKKPRKLPKAPNIAPEDAINADGDEFIFDGTDRQMRDPRKFARSGVRMFNRTANSGRRSGAGPARKQGTRKPSKTKLVRDLLDKSYRPLKTRRGDLEFTEDDLAVLATHVLIKRRGRFPHRRFGNMDREEATKSLVDSLRSYHGYDHTDKKSLSEAIRALTELRASKIRTDEESQRQLRKVMENAAVDSPAFRRALEEYGVPRITIVDELPESVLREWYDKEGEPRPADKLGKDAQAYTDGLYIRFLGSMWDDWFTRQGRRKWQNMGPEEDIYGVEGSSAPEQVLRHEVGHVLHDQATAFGTPRQRDGVLALEMYYADNIEQWAAIQKQYNVIAKDFGEDAAETWIRTSVNPAYIPEPDTVWWTNYAETNPQEFMAELFAISTSPSENVRNMIPDSIRPLVTMWLGFNPWEEFDNA